MASFPTQDQVNNLVIKKFQGAAFTDVEQAVTLEAIGSSSNKIIPSNIFNQSVPIPAPPKGIEEIIPNGGKKIASADPRYGYITYYENLILSSVNYQIAFYYAGTDPDDILNTNLLIDAIPFNYDGKGSYSIKVSDSEDPEHESIPINGEKRSVTVTF